MTIAAKVSAAADIEVSNSSQIWEALSAKLQARHRRFPFPPEPLALLWQIVERYGIPKSVFL
jgi:hypothetical protein